MDNQEHAMKALTRAVAAIDDYCTEHDLPGGQILALASIGLSSAMMRYLGDNAELQKRFATALSIECNSAADETATMRDALKDYTPPAHGWQLN